MKIPDSKDLWFLLTHVVSKHLWLKQTAEQNAEQLYLQEKFETKKKAYKHFN